MQLETIKDRKDREAQLAGEAANNRTQAKGLPNKKDLQKALSEFEVLLADKLFAFVKDCMKQVQRETQRYGSL